MDAEMTDLVERLRACADDPMWAGHAEVPKGWLREAADEIGRLRARVAELEKEVLDTTWQDHADFWQQRALKAESQVNEMKKLLVDAASYYPHFSDHLRIRIKDAAMREGK